MSLAELWGKSSGQMEDVPCEYGECVLDCVLCSHCQHRYTDGLPPVSSTFDKVSTVMPEVCANLREVWFPCLETDFRLVDLLPSTKVVSAMTPRVMKQHGVSDHSVYASFSEARTRSS